MEQSLEMNLLRRAVVGDVIRRHARAKPDRAALLVESMDGTSASYTWREFDDLINKTANALTHLGVRKGDKVGVFGLNSAEFAALLYATGRIGAIVAPAGASLRDKDLAYVIDHSDASILLVDEFLVEAFLPVQADLGSLPIGFLRRSVDAVVPDGWVDFRSQVAAQDAAEPQVVVDADDIASLTYTSGTEAAPKGVLMAHANLLNMIVSGAHWGLRSDDVALHVLPLFYTGGVGVLMACHLLGQTVVLSETPEPPRMAAAMRKHSVTFIVLPPTLWIRMLQQPDIVEAAATMRIAATFGATISESMLAGWARVRPEMEWISYYG